MGKIFNLEMTETDGQAETVRIYYEEYPAETEVADRLAPTKESPYVDVNWSEFEIIDTDNHRQIELLPLGVFTNRNAYYRVGASFINSGGDESNIVCPVSAFMIASPPADPVNVRITSEIV